MLAAVLVSSAGVQLQGIRREHQTKTKKQDVRSVVELLVEIHKSSIPVS